MILADTSIWIDLFRTGNPVLTQLLNGEQVLAHPWIIGELALGLIPHRDETLDNLSNLPRAPLAEDNEVLTLINSAQLHGTGIGYVDAHLLASTRLLPGTALWTRDKRLAVVADQLQLAFHPEILQ